MAPKLYGLRRGSINLAKFGIENLSSTPDLLTLRARDVVFVYVQ